MEPLFLLFPCRHRSRRRCVTLVSFSRAEPTKFGGPEKQWDSEWTECVAVGRDDDDVFERLPVESHSGAEAPMEPLECL